MLINAQRGYSCCGRDMTTPTFNSARGSISESSFWANIWIANSRDTSKRGLLNAISDNIKSRTSRVRAHCSLWVSGGPRWWRL
ncbi:hypothetical protein BJY04DRAFT_194211 [Aspergillus karnatakaensis]|uniref:uncharacterized protein n=1 Tax=Aspergillus karnatakaensis TaxID=1810916 RepID=UPI003CCCBB73